jgi:hypothetical protein
VPVYRNIEGWDFSMLPTNFALNLKDHANIVAEFERVNSCGIYVWSHERMMQDATKKYPTHVRIPPSSVKFDREIYLLLYSGHFVLIKNLAAFLGRQSKSTKWLGKKNRFQQTHPSEEGQYEAKVPCPRCCGFPSCAASPTPCVKPYTPQRD